jgi:hypothetical protein
MKEMTKGSGVLTIVAAICAIASMAFGNPAVVLDGTEIIQDLSGAAGSETLFQIEVPCGAAALVIRTTGGTGDCALYASHGVPPTTSSFEYCDGVDGNLEIILVNRPRPGTWFILLYGDTAYAGVKLWARIDDRVSLSLANGVPATGLHGVIGSRGYYAIEVPEGQDFLEIDTCGGAGDVDLYVKRGDKPTFVDYDAQSATAGADESVRIDRPESGTWYILLYGYSGYDDVSLTATYGTSDAVCLLRDESPIDGLSGSSGSRAWYAIDVPAGQAGIAFYLHGGVGDCDMYIKRGAKPTESDWDYRPIDLGNEESISIANPQAGRWYILLKGDSAYSGVTLEADYWAAPLADVTPLASGRAATGIAGAAGDELFFSIEAPIGVKTLEIKMSGGSGDADLYVRHGSLPTVAEYDRRTGLHGNEECIVIDNPSDGVWYIMVRGYQAFADVSLTATYDGVSPDGVISLRNGGAVSGLAGRADGEAFFVIDVPEGQSQLVISTSGGTGDVDLYVCLGQKPTTDEWDYRPYLAGNDETVIVKNPKAGRYYVLLRGYMAYAGVTLQAGFAEAKP